MLDIPLPPAIEPSAIGARRCCYYALAFAAMVACVYLCLIVSIDNSNIGTTNGLWKTPAVSEWEHGTGAPVDSGEILYLPVYGELARLIPDSAVQYGAHTPVATFRKMAVLNGIFGGIACGLIFFLALRFTDSLWAAAMVAMAHAGAGFIILNSINSEDIIPAYTFFAAAAVFFFESLRSGKVWHYLAAAFFLAMTTLFHWTLMAPGLAAFGAVFALLWSKKKISLITGAAWGFAFLCITQILVLLVLPRLHIPIWAVILSGKASAAGGWIGLSPEKPIYAGVGIGNYFTGGANITDYRAALQGVSLRMTIVSWIYAAVTLAACLVTVFSRRAALGLKCLALFGAVVFAAGEGLAIDGQPQDPQMQIQPMLAGTAGLILLSVWLLRSTGRWRMAPVGILIALMGFNGLWNIGQFRSQRGGDSAELRNILTLDALFPKDRTVFVAEGFDGWLTWQYAILWKGDRPDFLEHSLMFTTPFIGKHGISGSDAAAITIRRIDGALAAGMRIVGTDLWIETLDEFSGSLSTVTTPDQARICGSIVRSHYRTGQRWKTPEAEFVELLPL